jgi:hypothetical protein
LALGVFIGHIAFNQVLTDMTSIASALPQQTLAKWQRGVTQSAQTLQQQVNPSKVSNLLKSVKPSPQVRWTLLTGVGTTAALLGGVLLNTLAEHVRGGGIIDGVYQAGHPSIANDIHALRGIWTIPTITLIVNHIDNGYQVLKRLGSR